MVTAASEHEHVYDWVWELDRGEAGYKVSLCSKAEEFVVRETIYRWIGNPPTQHQ